MSSTTASTPSASATLPAEVEGVVTRVGLRHQDGERRAGPEGARAERDRDRAVDPARDARRRLRGGEAPCRRSPAARRRSPRPPLPGRSRGGRGPRLSRCRSRRRLPASCLRVTNPDDVVDRVEVLRSELVVPDADAERVLEVAHQFEDSGRIDHPRLDSDAEPEGLPDRLRGRSSPREMSRIASSMFESCAQPLDDNRLGIQTGIGRFLPLSLEEMCGLAGVHRRAQNQVDSSLLLAMAGEMRHRGPDGTGLYLDGRFGMTNTRLAIIDLAGGDQPLSRGARALLGDAERRDLQLRRAAGRAAALGHRFATSLRHRGDRARLRGVGPALPRPAERRLRHRRLGPRAAGAAAGARPLRRAAAVPRRARRRRLLRVGGEGAPAPPAARRELDPVGDRRARSRPGRRCRTARPSRESASSRRGTRASSGRDGDRRSARWWDLHFARRRRPEDELRRGAARRSSTTPTGSGCAPTCRSPRT